MAFGKWIGGLLGLYAGGPIGALIGYALGKMVDKVIDTDIDNTESGYDQTEDPTGGYQRRQQRENRNGFLSALMILSAHIIQADGKIMHSEMECMRQFLRGNFGEEAVSQGEQIILRLFEKRKQMGDAAWQQQIRACCMQLAGMMPEEQRLLLLRYLVDIARADGHVAPEELQCLHEIAANMRLSTDEVDQLLGMGKQTLQDAYRVLGITPSASDDEVRKAYRKMALKHHPDKVANLGEDVRKEAEQKFKDIAAAKELIYAARGMS